uniref:S1-like domain-containing protein n=1 Tax=viral metagenome TaxID=1070528 RepID=A0A6C0K2Y2_9ZZZZ
MVKNTKGGKGAKSMARKSFAAGAAGFPVPTCDMEQLAIVTKMFGPSCDVLLADGTKLLCHIRNKFKGRHKSGNLISLGTIVLIGYREWEPDTSRKNCDLLFVYDNLQTSSLADRFTLPDIPSDTKDFVSDILFDNFDTSHTHTHTHTIDDTTTTKNGGSDALFDDL